MLQPAALVRLSVSELRFCPTHACPVVYFSFEDRFDREDLAVPVFQKEPAGERTVCYCLGIREHEIGRELAETGRSTAGERITTLVKAGRCACEVKNPQGTCCLGNVATLTTAVMCALARRRALGTD